MPTFCRHNRFIERCPICSKTLPGNEPAPATRTRRASGSGSRPASARRPRGDGLRVRREDRSVEDGYRSELVPGLRSSADAARLADEIGFAARRLAALAGDPPGLYAQARAQRENQLESATWTCFLLAYLCPSEDEDPFAATRAVLAAAPDPATLPAELAAELDELPLGPRSSHRPGQGLSTLHAYGQWVQRSGGTQAAAFGADPGWTPQRRFARAFERLALPGLSRAARYELLTSMGRLGIYDLRADSLHLGGARADADDPATMAAKRVFGIADAMLLDRRAAALAQDAGVPLEALDLALANWSAEQRATMGFSAPEQPADAAGAAAALGV